MYIDSHCHLDRLDFSGQSMTDGVNDALARARQLGINGFLCIGIDLDKLAPLFDIQQQHSDVWLSVGAHPLSDTLISDGELLAQLSTREGVIAIGETGLDYHYSAETKQQQKQSFAQHLEVAADVAKPVIVHTREAQQDTLDLIKLHGRGNSGILHCFTETWDMAKQAIDLGYYISFSGILTFNNASALREVASKVPFDRLLIETDSPYLAPVPYRGKSNEPAYVVKVAEQLAQLRGMSVADIAKITTDNFHRLFPQTV